VLTDPIADMLTRIRNANRALHDSASMPTSKMKEEIAQTAGARRDHLQARIAHLEQTIHRKQQKAVERWNGFQARQQAKRKILERKAVAARRAIKDLAQTTVA